MDEILSKYHATKTRTVTYSKHMLPHVKPTDEIKSTHVIRFGDVLRLYIVYAVTEHEGGLRAMFLLMTFIEKPKVLTAVRPDQTKLIDIWLDRIKTKLTEGGLI